MRLYPKLGIYRQFSSTILLPLFTNLTFPIPIESINASSSSPPSLLRRRRYGVAGYIAPKDTSPDVKYQTPQPLLQPVYSHRAADDLHHHLSTAITLQTTSTITCLQPSPCRRPPPSPVYSHYAADDLHNLSTAITP